MYTYGIMRGVYSGVFVVGIVFLIGIFFTPFSYAANPQFLVTWKAQTKVPVWYAGKALPVKDGVVLVSVSLIDSSGGGFGKLLDLSNSEIRWYLKGELVQKGKGITSLSILNKDFPGNYIDLQVSVQYADEQGTRFLDSYNNIPIVNPEVVIEYRNLQPFFSAGSDVAFVGHPFYFTNQFLKSEWNLGGTTPVADVYDIKIEKAPATLRDIQFTVWNSEKNLEKAQKIMRVQAN